MLNFMTRSHINFIGDYGVVLKFERFFHLFDRSYGLDSYIRLEYLLLILSLKADA